MPSCPLPRRRLLALLPATALLAACGKRAPKGRPIAQGSNVLALGDSLTAGVGADAATAYPAVERYLQQHHPYETPEIIAWPVAAGLPAYLTWVNTETISSQGNTQC